MSVEPSLSSSYAPLRREKLSETVAERLRQQITGGGLEPGARLPGHRELAEAFSVGLSSVREAISMLASEGLVQTRAGRGTFVRERAPALAFSHDGTPLSEQDLEQVIEAREVLELQLAAMAAERASAEDVTLLRERLRAMQDAAEDGAAYAEADLRLHLAIARAARNRFLQGAVEEMRQLTLRSMEVSFSTAVGQPGGLEVSLASHRRLVDAIEAGDAEAARAVVFEIMSRNHTQVLERRGSA